MTILNEIGYRGFIPIMLVCPFIAAVLIMFIAKRFGIQTTYGKSLKGAFLTLFGVMITGPALFISFFLIFMEPTLKLGGILSILVTTVLIWCVIIYLFKTSYDTDWKKFMLINLTIASLSGIVLFFAYLLFIGIGV